MLTLRRLTSKGLEALNTWLDQVVADGMGSVPEILLSGSAETERHPAERDIDETMQFRTRLEWGEYADSVLRDLPTRMLASDKGLWSWLTLLYFDQICPPAADGRRRVLDRRRYIPTITDFRSYYRHLLLSPWSIVRHYSGSLDCAMAVLATPLHAPGEAAEQLSARQDLITARPLMEVASRLYFDREARRLRRGAGSKGPGTPRRFVTVAQQLMLTLDLRATSAETLQARLPKEFRRFISPGGAHKMKTVTGTDGPR